MQVRPDRQPPRPNNRYPWLRLSAVMYPEWTGGLAEARVYRAGELSSEAVTTVSRPLAASPAPSSTISARVFKFNT
jgi:hypothetical protein